MWPDCAPRPGCEWMGLGGHWPASNRHRPIFAHVDPMLYQFCHHFQPCRTLSQTIFISSACPTPVHHTLSPTLFSASGEHQLAPLAEVVAVVASQNNADSPSGLGTRLEPSLRTLHSTICTSNIMAKHTSLGTDSPPVCHPPFPSSNPGRKKNMMSRQNNMNPLNLACAS